MCQTAMQCCNPMQCEKTASRLFFFSHDFFHGWTAVDAAEAIR